MKQFVLILFVGFSGFSQTASLYVSAEPNRSELGVYSLKTVKTEVNNDFNVLVYPNPVTAVLNININEAHDGPFFYRVFDEKAALLLTKQFINTTEIIDFTSLPSQVYFVEIATETKKITKKIIKK